MKGEDKEENDESCFDAKIISEDNSPKRRQEGGRGREETGTAASEGYGRSSPKRRRESGRGRKD